MKILRHTFQYTVKKIFLVSFGIFFLLSAIACAKPKTPPSESSDVNILTSESISLLHAKQIAQEYWAQWSEADGYVIQEGRNERAPSHVHVFIVQQWVSNHYTTLDEIWIDQTTGKTIVPHE